MTTLTAEKFKELYGDEAIKKFNLSSSEIPETKGPGYWERLVTNYKNAINEYKEGVTESATEVQSGKVASGLARGALRPAATSVRTIFAPITEAIAPLIDKAIDYASDNKTVQNIANTKAISSFLDNIEEWQKKNPELSKDVKDVFDVVTSLVGAKAVNKVGNVITDVGTKTGELAGKVGQTASEVKTGVGNIVQVTGEKIYKSAEPFTPNMQMAEQIRNFRANTPLAERVKAGLKNEVLPEQPTTLGDTALKYRLLGTQSAIGVQAKAAMNDIWKNKIVPALDSIKEKIPKDNVFKEIQNKINDIADLSQKEIMQHSFDAIKDTYKDIKFWSYREAQDLKSSLAKRLPDKIFRGKPTGALNEVNNIFSSELRGYIRGKLDKFTASLYDDYGNLRLIAERGAKALTHPERLGGSGKLLWGTIEKGTTPIKTVGGKIIQKIGEIIK